MKLLNYIIPVGLSVILASCNRSGPHDEFDNVPIAFSSTQTEATKAPYPDGSSYGVLAYYNGSETPNFMYNQKITNSSGVFHYDPVKYWPISSDRKISFYAYHPHNGAGITMYDASSTKKSLNFNLTSAADIDLMSAHLEGKSKDDGSICFTFEHVLTQLSFTARNNSSNFAIQLNSVKLVNVLPAMELLLNENNGNNIRNISGTPIGIPIIANASIDIPIGGTVTLDNGKCRYLIPQNLTNVAIEITYTANGTLISKSIPLAHTAPWQSSGSLRYTLSFDPVMVTSKSVGWSSVDNSGSVGTSTTIMEYGVPPYGSVTIGSGPTRKTYNGLRGEGNATNGAYLTTETDVYEHEQPYYKLEIDKEDIYTDGLKPLIYWKDLRSMEVMNGDICKKRRGTKWRMPRLSELKMMTLNKTALQSTDSFEPFSPRYWSGTEYSKTDAWDVAFTNDDAANHTFKVFSYSVRCVKELP